MMNDYHIIFMITKQTLPKATQRHLYTSSTTVYDSENKRGTHKKNTFKETLLQ